MTLNKSLFLCNGAIMRDSFVSMRMLSRSQLRALQTLWEEFPVTGAWHCYNINSINRVLLIDRIAAKDWAEQWGVAAIPVLRPERRASRSSSPRRRIAMQSD